MGYGILITLILLLVYRKLGLYKRPGFKVYNWVAKLWILYVLGVGVFFSYQMALNRCLHKAISDYREDLVKYVYNEYMAPFIMDVAVRDQVVHSVQELYKKGESVEDAFFASMEQQSPAVQTESDDFGVAFVSSLVQQQADKYKSEILVTLMYTANQKAEESYGISAGHEGMTMEEFKAGVDILKNAPPSEVSDGAQKVLLSFMGKKLNKMKRDGQVSIWVLGSLFMLLPLVELLVFRMLVKTGKMKPAVVLSSPEDVNPKP
jgi:hypothetical protein